MDNNLPELLTETYESVNNYYNERHKQNRYFACLSWAYIWAHLKKFPSVNPDLSEIFMHNTHSNFPLYSELKNNVLKEQKSQYFIDDQDWYYAEIRFEYKGNSYSIYLSWLLQFYSLSNKLTCLNNDIKNKISLFLESKWYKNITNKILETELDIIWSELIPYYAWLEKAKMQYKEMYIDENYYYIDEMNAPDYPKDRVKDFESYYEEEYPGAFNIRNLLFWED